LRSSLCPSPSALIAAGDVPGLCALVGRLGETGVDLRQYARDAVAHLREVFLIQVAPEAGLVETTEEHRTALQAQAGRIGRVELLRAVDLLAECQAQMRRGNTRLPLELALIKAAMPEASGDPAALAARMDRLERRTGLLDGSAPAEPASASTPVAEVAPPAQQPAPAAPEVLPEPPKPAPVPVAQPEPAPQRAATAPAPAQEDKEPAPVRVSGAATGPVDLDLIQGSWQAILDEVKTRKRSLQAWLLMARPIWLKGEVLGLEFQAGYGFHADNCGREDSQAILGEVFDKVLGARLRVDCKVAEGTGSPGPVADDSVSLEEQAESVAETEAAAAAGTLPDDAEAHEDAIQTLTRDLGAVVLDDDDPKTPRS
jgi:DNA polymerase-3 subunit gamma/tau